MAGEPGSRGTGRPHGAWESLYSALRLEQGLISAPTIVLAAAATTVISVIAAFASLHVTVVEAVGIAVLAIVVASSISLAFALFNQSQQPSPGEEKSAISRIQAIVDSLLERYGMEEPEIDPPIKVFDTTDASHIGDLDRGIASAQLTSYDFFLSQFLSQQGHAPRLTVILGEPGAGKTSLLLRLSQRMLDVSSEGGREFIPLFIKCRDWPESVMTFHAWVTSAALASYDIPKHVTDYWIRSGKLFIALDGLHELSSKQFEEFSHAINGWVQAPEGTRIAISSTMQPGIIEERVRSLGIDQICVIQPLPYTEIQSLLQQTLRHLRTHAGENTAQQMDIWVQDLISRNSILRGPALVGLLAEAFNDSAGIYNDIELEAVSKDPAGVAFRLASSFFSRGAFEVAAESFRMITKLPSSRWHVPSYTLLATCEYVLGNADRASDTMTEAVTLRLQESIRPTPNAVELSADERRCLDALSVDVGLDTVQISSAANLTLSRTSQALQALRERGLVETVARTDDLARFRRSTAAADIW